MEDQRTVLRAIAIPLVLTALPALLALPVLGAGCGGAAPDPKAVVNIDNTKIVNSNITIVQVLGGFGELPSSGAEQYRSIMADLKEPEDLVKAKQELKIEHSGWASPLEVTPSASGFRARGRFAVTVKNASEATAYRLAGFGGMFGQYTTPEGQRVVIRSDTAGRVEARAICLAPGGSGELVFDVDRPVQDILAKARDQDVPITEHHLSFLSPNDGLSWRPNVSGYSGLSATVEKGCDP